MKKHFLCFWLLLLWPMFGEASPQRFLLEVKFGPYSPSVGDSISLQGRTTYSDVFGDPSSAKGSKPAAGWLGQGQLDYQLFQRFGILSIGISAGYHYRTARQFSFNAARQGYCSVLDDGAGGRRYVYPAVPDRGLAEQQASYSDCVSSNEDKLNVVPLALLVSYRMDVLDRRFRIPLIPYLKAGLAYYVWWLGNTDEYVTTVTLNNTQETDKAQGGVFGLVLLPGLSLNLSALDVAAARAIDQEIGLNRVTLFAELNYAFVNGFGSRSKLDLSDLGFSAGLGFEF